MSIPLDYEEKLSARLRAKHRSWYYRIRRSIDFINLAESDWQRWRHHVGERVGNRDIFWTNALSVATLEELEDLDELRNEKRLGI